MARVCGALLLTIRDYALDRSQMQVPHRRRRDGRAWLRKSTFAYASIDPFRAYTSVLPLAQAKRLEEQLAERITPAE